MYTAYTKGDAKMLLNTCMKTARDSDEAHWEYCKALHAIYYGVVGKEERPVYEVLGHDTWYSFVEERLGLHVTTATQMVSTAHFFTVRMVDVWEGQVLPRQMMRTLSAAQRKTVNKANFQQWMAKAMKMTPCQLEHELHGRRKKVSVGFNFDSSVGEEIKELLDDLVESKGYSNRGEALLDILSPRLKKFRDAS